MGIISTITVIATIYKICIQKKQQCKHHLDVLPIQHSEREPDLSGKLTNSMFEDTSNVHFVVIDFEKEESNKTPGLSDSTNNTNSDSSTENNTVVTNQTKETQDALDEDYEGIIIIDLGTVESKEEPSLEDDENESKVCAENRSVERLENLTCSKCDEIFSDTNELQAHMKKSHESDKTFPQQSLSYLTSSPQHVEDPKTTLNLKKVVVPTDMTSQFLKLASQNSLLGLETLGTLGGQVRDNVYYITHLVLPKQVGTQTTCTMHDEAYENWFNIYQTEQLKLLGWIHSHPQFSVFFSSVDVHQQYRFQVDVPEAIGIVCSIKDDDTGYLKLTDEGMTEVASCTKINQSFHKHTNANSFIQADHLEFSNSKLTVIDQR